MNLIHLHHLKGYTELKLISSSNTCILKKKGRKSRIRHTETSLRSMHYVCNPKSAVPKLCAMGHHTESTGDSKGSQYFQEKHSDI